MFHPDSQDDKILPKHIRITPEVFFHTYKIRMEMSGEPKGP